MRETVQIIDDFLDNAADLREAALRLTYAAPQEGGSGRSSVERINIEGLGQQVAWLVNEALVPVPAHQSHGRFRLTLAQDCGATDVRAETAAWHGILYLSRTEGSEGGIDFLRHIPTNTDGGDAKMRQAILERDAADETSWDVIMHVPIRFNRLVLYRPELWHRSTPGFGDRPENGRLDYSMSFNSEQV